MELSNAPEGHKKSKTFFRENEKGLGKTKFFKKKRGQLHSEVFIYIIAVIVCVLIVLFGYNAIQKVYTKGEQALEIRFETSLKESIETINYGSVDIQTFEIPLKYSELCFTNVNNKDELPQIFLDLYPLIGEAVEEKDNVFLTGKDFNSFKVEQLELPYKVYCVPIINGKVNLRIESKLKGISISSIEPVSAGIPKDIIAIYEDFKGLDDDFRNLLDYDLDEIYSDLEEIDW